MPTDQCCSPPWPAKVLSVADVNAGIHNWSKSRETGPDECSALNENLHRPPTRASRNIPEEGVGRMWEPEDEEERCECAFWTRMATVLRLTAAVVTRTRSRHKLSPQLNKLLPSLGYNKRMWRWWEKCQGMLGESGETGAYGLNIGCAYMDSKE